MLGIVSDEQGVFQLPAERVELDTLIVSYIGYATKSLPLSKSESNLRIELDQISKELQAVTVTPLADAREIFERAVSDYRRERRTSAHICRAMYQEKMVSKGDPILMIASLGFSVFAGDSGRFAPLGKQNFYCDNTKVQFAEEWVTYGPKKSMPPLGNYSIGNFIMHVENYGLLGSKSYGEYKVKTLEVAEEGYLLSFVGNGEKGTIRLSEDFQIRKIRYQHSKKIWSSVLNRRIRGEVNISFVYFEDRPFVSRVTMSYNKMGDQHSLHYVNLIQKLDDFDVGTEEIVALQRYARNPYIRFREAEWRYFEENLPAEFDTSDVSLKGGLEIRDRWYSQEESTNNLAIKILDQLRSFF